MSETTTAPAAKTARTRKPATPPITPPAPPVAPKPAAPKAAPPAPAPEPKAKTAADYRREIDLLIIAKAGDLVIEYVPAALRDQVAQMIANQLHHMSTKKLGWPEGALPKPERSDWA